MFRFWLFLFGCLLCGEVMSQTITGNVIDGLDRGYLDKVWVVNLSNNDSSQTNERGYFRVLGASGDSLYFSRDNFIPKKIEVGEDTHFVVEIYLNARLMPVFDLYAQQYRIPFDLGNVTGMRSLNNRPTGPGKIYSGMADNPGLQPAITLDGPFSYFMKSERQKREYARKMAFEARRKEYLEVIQSDSIMQALKTRFSFEDAELDSLIIAFNLENSYHQFLDVKKERVEQLLLEFMSSYAYRKTY